MERCPGKLFFPFSFFFFPLKATWGREIQKKIIGEWLASKFIFHETRGKKREKKPLRIHYHILLTYIIKYR
ncbi:hypothetical protein F5X96DRAFT_641085 [Biscogniauxia mediterranea]|nr:hypothetical protein F5X96DRAFT_641085 [Biscogniauxia mediterranea]